MPNISFVNIFLLLFTTVERPLVAVFSLAARRPGKYLGGGGLAWRSASRGADARSWHEAGRRRPGRGRESPLFVEKV